MSTGRKAAGQFLFWLLLGLAAGVFLAAVLSYREYQTMADVAGAALQSDSLAKGVKNSYAAQSASLEMNKDGSRYLESYGYHPMRNWGAYLPFTVSISVLLFQLAGWYTFRVRYREGMQTKKRIRELTEYLRDVNSGGGAVLCRNEDDFSHLEDEMYKTVIELQSAQEAAEKNHEVLARRIADIAHQLKTPLTSMSLMTELLEEYQTIETEAYYSRLSNQIERLKNLVTGLLSLAKLDSHGVVFHMEKVKMSELVDAVEELLREMMTEHGVSLAVEESKGKQEIEELGCFIYADRQWTEEALLNILKNCVEHTPNGGRIMISYSRNPIYTELRIEDEGRGFAAKDLPHIFERFYRGEGAAKDNAGIGLALAKAVLEQQNGRIYAENTADGHAGFRIKWYF